MSEEAFNGVILGSVVKKLHAAEKEIERQRAIIERAILSIKGIAECAYLSDNWNSYGASKITRQSIHDASYAVAEHLSNGELPWVQPLPDGTIEVSLGEDASSGVNGVEQSPQNSGAELNEHSKIEMRNRGVRKDERGEG